MAGSALISTMLRKAPRRTARCLMAEAVPGKTGRTEFQGGRWRGGPWWNCAPARNRKSGTGQASTCGCARQWPARPGVGRAIEPRKTTMSGVPRLSGGPRAAPSGPDRRGEEGLRGTWEASTLPRPLRQGRRRKGTFPQLRMHGIEESDPAMAVTESANERGSDASGGVDGAKGRGRRKSGAARRSRRSGSDNGRHMRRSLTQPVPAAFCGSGAG